MNVGLTGTNTHPFYLSNMALMTLYDLWVLPSALYHCSFAVCSINRHISLLNAVTNLLVWELFTWEIPERIVDLYIYMIDEFCGWGFFRCKNVTQSLRKNSRFLLTFVKKISAVA